MRLTHRLGFAVLACVLPACSGNDSTSSLSNTSGNERLVLTLSAQTDTVPESTSKQLTARITDLTGFIRPGTVTWRSIDPNVATVANGLVTGVAQGVTSVIAATTGAADTALIVVTENAVMLDVQPSEVEIVAGDTIDFVATLRTRSGDAIPVGTFTWSASDTASASFVSAGILHAKNEAEISVSAEAMMRRGTSTVRIFRAPVASVTITPGTASIYKGSSITLVAKPRDWQGRLLEREVSWGSSDYSKATVDDNGRVTGIGVGAVVITATVESKTASATINVMAPAATNVELELPSSTSVGAEIQAATTVRDASGEVVTGKTVAYQSANPSIATVTSTGKVRGIAVGTVNISAIVDGVIARRSLSVQGTRATSMSISPAAPSVSFGQQSQLSASVLDENGNTIAGQSVTWSSSNPGSVSVSATGLIQGVGAGASVITASSGELSASVTATVANAPVASVRVSPSSVSLVAGNQRMVTAEALDANNTVLVGRAVSWSSQNPVVATVTNAGVVTAVATGSATLVATVEGKSANLPVTVSAAPLAPVAAVALTLGSASLTVGQTTQAVPALTDASGNGLTGRSIQYTSLDPAVASVNTSGQVTALAAGTVAIVATSEGKSGSASLTVAAPAPAAVARIEIQVPKETIGVNEQIQSTVKLFDEAGNLLSPTGRTVTYRSDNAAIITVSSAGLVKGVAGGSTKMRVTSGSATATSNLTVEGSAPPPTVASITVTPTTSSLTVGGSPVQAAATAKTAEGGPIAGTTFTWTTSNSSVATVSSSGLVSAVGAGTATIHAAASGVTGNMSVTVTAPPSTSSVVASVTVSLSPSSISIGGSSQASAVARNSSGAVISGKTASWSLSGSLLGAVSSTGLVSGLLAGVLPVKATIDGISGTASLTINAVVTPPPTSAAVEMPRVYLNFPYPAKTGATIVVNAGDNLQTALNNAKRGDEIVLASGATFSGNFILPAKSGNASNGWIVIRSSQSGQLPSIGSRVGPQHASLMARIQSPNQQPGIQTAPGSSGWRLVGLDVTVSSAVTAQVWSLVSLGDVGAAQNTLAAVPSDIVLDRMYIHGQTTTNLSRCVALNSARTEVSDSYLSECHGKGFDSQAILGWNGPGPFKIVNNMLAGAGENIMFGGGDPSIPGLVPSDIEIRRNYIYKPISWKGVWTVKNLLETKNAARLLIEGNVLDGEWADAQNGMAILFRSTNQGGGCRWCRTTDVTFRHNLLRNSGGGIAFVGGDVNPTDTTARRIFVSENVLDGLNAAPYLGANARAFLFTRVANVTVQRTVATGSLYQGMWTDRDYPSTGVAFSEVVIPRGLYGIGADAVAEGSAGLNLGLPGFTWNSVTILGNYVANYPTGTVFSTSEPAWAASVRSVVNSATAGVAIP